MNTFKNAVDTQTTFTTNGMKALVSTTNSCVDLFFKIGASRGKDIKSMLVAAIVDDLNLAVRIILWTRDVRQGAGERDLFRQACRYLDETHPEVAMAILPKIKELGRFDDYFVFQNDTVKYAAFNILKEELYSGNALAAKWCPREKSINKFLDGKLSKEQLASMSFADKFSFLSPAQKLKVKSAKEFRKFLGLSEKDYRKLLSSCTKVVESQMCSNEWDKINFSHVPSLASSRYKKAFDRHTPKYAEYVAKLVSGDASVKVNAEAVFPYDVIKGVYFANYSKTQKDLIISQWKALPNFVGDASILPMVDVSGSMTCAAGKSKEVTCLDVAVSLGLYLSEKNKGKFKDLFLTFSERSELLHLKGNVIERMEQMKRSAWGMNTNLELAFQKVLNIAKEGNVPQEEMPSIILILSDMQFDGCVMYSGSAIQMIARKYESAGYKMPQVVFWNINAHDNVPVSSNQLGFALVSGFSPAITKSIVQADLSEFTPMGIMLKTITNPRYDW